MQAAIVPGAPARPGVPARPAGGTVQRSVAVRLVTSNPGERAPAQAAGLAAGDHTEPPTEHVDPGAIAVARGLAHREPDGSVVFDLRPSLALARQAPPPPPHRDLPVSSYAVQRQEDNAVPVDSPAFPADSTPAAVGLPTTAAPAAATALAVPAASAVPAAPVPAGPQLDELARQLFGPLAARLKAELRLDRERAGLLTDLRQ